MHKGIILAGGSGSRLYPLTLTVSKQLLPVYNKPMIYYPLSVLMLADIREILIISTPQDKPLFEELLKDGKQWGLNFSYAVQKEPRGLSDAFIVGKEFIGNDSVCMILGDNIFYGHGLPEALQSAKKNSGATVFGYWVKEPSRYGVVDFDDAGNVCGLEEKPENPKSNYAVTGLYFYDNKVVKYAEELLPSKRGELEITDLNKRYLKDDSLAVEKLGRGIAWLDTGTHESLLQASNFIEVIESRQGLQVASPEEIAFSKGWITGKELSILANAFKQNEYGDYLKNLIPHSNKK